MNKNIWFVSEYVLRWPSVYLPLFAAMVSLLFLLGCFFMYWQPLYLSVDKKNILVGEVKKDFNQQVLVNKIHEAYSVGNKEVAEFESRLLKLEMRSDVIDSINQLAVESGIKIVSESFSKVGRRLEFDVFDYSLNLKGSYKGIRVFLIGLNDISVNLYVEQASFIKSKDAIEGYVRLLAYRKVEGSEEDS